MLGLPRPAWLELLAVRDATLAYVGDAEGVRSFIGPHTKRLDGGGHVVIPGLIASHIHPLDILDVNECDLNSTVKSLREIATFVHACVGRLHLPPGNSTKRATRR